MIYAIAKRCRSLKNKKNSAVQLFSYCRFSLYSGKKGYIIDESEILELFWGIKEDLSRLSLAQYFCELCLVLLPEENYAGDFLRFFLNSLFYLSNQKKSAAFLKAVFEMRVCSICGYMPNLIGCHKCKAYELPNMNFIIESGIIICENCISSEEKIQQGYALKPGLLAALRHIIYSSVEKLFSFSISKETETALFDICEKYVTSHVGANFKSLNFYKSIAQM